MKRKRTSSLVTDPPTSLQQTPNGEHKLQTFPIHDNATAYVKSLLQSELEKKRGEWNKWMNKSDRGRGIDIDMKRLNQTVKQLIWDKVFQKVSYSYIKMSRADYHCNYNATVEIEGLVITHWSYDDQGCSTQWNISVQSKAQKDIKRVLNFEDDVLSYSRNALQFIRSRLELDECKLTDPELLKIVVLALPWKWGRNCVFMSDAMEAYDELP